MMVLNTRKDSMYVLVNVYAVTPIVRKNKHRLSRVVLRVVTLGAAEQGGYGPRSLMGLQSSCWCN